MNINVNEMLLVRKNNFMKLANSQAGTVVTEPTETKPEETLKALEMQGQNNIAFQGMNMSVMKKIGFNTVLALAAVAGLSSCDGDPWDLKDYPIPPTETTITNNVEVNVDMTSWMEMWKSMVEQQQMTNEQLVLLSTQMSELMELLQAGQISNQEYQERMYEIQKLQLEQLIKNNDSNDEIIARLDKIDERLANQEITYTQALDELKAILGEISGTLADIKTLLKDVADKITLNQEKLMQAQEKANELLAGLYEQGKLSLENEAELLLLVGDIKNNVETIKGNTWTLIDIAKDDTKHKELIEALKNAVGSDYDKYEEMFKFYGLSIKEAIEMSADQLEAALKTFMEKYETNSADLSTKLDEISAKIDKLIEQTSKIANDVSTYNQIFAKNWDKALELLSGFANDMDGLKEAQDLSNKYLDALLGKVDAMKAQLDKIAADNDGMTIDEFKAYMQERDEAQYQKFVKFMIDMGLDKLAGDVATIKDLVSQLNAKVQNMKDYSGQLDKIIAKLDSIDWTAAENKGKLEQIIEILKNFKCNCDCGNSNEGVMDDLDNIFG